MNIMDTKWLSRGCLEWWELTVYITVNTNNCMHRIMKVIFARLLSSYCLHIRSWNKNFDVNSFLKQVPLYFRSVTQLRTIACRLMFKYQRTGLQKYQLKVNLNLSWLNYCPVPLPLIPTTFWPLINWKKQYLMLLLQDALLRLVLL